MKSTIPLLVALVGSSTPGLAQGLANRAGGGSSAAAIQDTSSADIRLLKLSSDEKVLVFLADADQDELTEIYAVKPQGRHVVKLSQPFAPGRAGAYDFLISPDGRTVLYLADHAARGRYELYSVPIKGGPVVKIARPGLSRAIDAFSYQFTLDSQGVVFIDRVGSGPRDLYVSPLDGGPFTKLSRSVGTVSTQSVLLSPDGERVVYQALGSSPTIRLFSTRVDGVGEPTLLATVSVAFGPTDRAISPDSSRVVYGGLSGEPNLFSVPVDGSAAPVRLNGELPVGARVLRWHLSPDGASVVYSSNEEDVDIFQVHSAPIDGSAPPLRLSDAASGPFIFDFLPSSSGLVAYLDPAAPGRFELESAPITASTAPEILSLPDENLQLSLPQFSGSWGPILRITPDGARALYAATDSTGQTSLSCAPLDGSAPPTTVASLTLGSLIPEYVFLLSPDMRPADLDFDPLGQRVVFIELEFELQGEPSGRLLSAPLDGSSPPVELSGPSSPGSRGPSLFVMSPSKGRVYFTADSIDPGVFELFSVPIDGHQEPRLLVDF